MYNNIVSNDPFGPLFDNLFNRSISDIVGADYTHDTPRANIIENDEAFVIQLAAPGLTKRDFDIKIDKDHLIVSAKRGDDAPSEEGEPAKTHKRKEYDYASFSRKFRLPNTIEKQTISAKYELGILAITLAKTAEAKVKGPRTVEIS